MIVRKSVLFDRLQSANHHYIAIILAVSAVAGGWGIGYAADTQTPSISGTDCHLRIDDQGRITGAFIQFIRPRFTAGMQEFNIV